jgi:glyoxylase-like metal-dependent hydrolase (beta-lactamase superfamily II)
MLAFRRDVLAPEAAAREIARIVGERAAGIQRIRFIEFTHSGERLRYTIALTWTDADWALRDRIYAVAEEVVRATGWYPLPQGERLSSTAKAKEAGVRMHPADTLRGVVDGPLKSISSAVNADGGCSVRVLCGTGSILLDSGLEGFLAQADTDRVVLLSHFHGDHAGGVLSGATGPLPVAASEGTARVLWARSSSGGLIRSRYVVLDPHKPLPLGANLTLRSFPVPHAPGAIGLELADSGSVLVYTGDVCLRTARHDFIPALEERLERGGARKKWVLVDATMVGRRHGASAEVAAKRLFSVTEANADVVVVADGAEQLLYAYMDLFQFVKSNQSVRSGVHFLLSPGLRGLFEIVHQAFIRRDIAQLDPFLLGQYGTSMSAWGESRWLYWLDRLREVPSDRRRIWMVARDELALVRAPTPPILALIGRGDPLPVASWQDVPRADVDTSPWTLHSDEATLADAVERLSKRGEVVLFHSFPKRMAQFIKRKGLSAHALGDNAINIS